MFRSGNSDIYDHKFTLLPKYGNWASPDYLRATVLYTKKKPEFNNKSKKITGGNFYRKKTFHRTKKNSSKRTTRSRKLL
jgi:hypothetical protein